MGHSTQCSQRRYPDANFNSLAADREGGRLKAVRMKRMKIQQFKAAFSLYTVYLDICIRLCRRVKVHRLDSHSTEERLFSCWDFADFDQDT